MIKKDFELIARTIRGLELSAAERAALAATFSAVLANTNPRFDCTRFLKACEAAA